MNDSTHDWRELLCRVLDGDSLSDTEAEQLRAALDGSGNQAEAIAWLQFELAAADRFNDPNVLTATRDRLFAKAVLRSKHREVTARQLADQESYAPAQGASQHPLQPASQQGQASQPMERPRSSTLVRWSSLILIAASLLLAVLLWGPGDRPADAYDAPLARGDFHILGWTEMTPAEVMLTRSDRLVTGGDGARMTLGGYCHVRLAPHTDVTVRGTAREEAIELHQGALQARVQPAQGEFRVLTPLGPVLVTGTEFEVSVEYPNGLPGDLSMNDTLKRVVVTVTVLSGTVWCQLGDAPITMGTGTEQVFAGDADDQRMQGEVVDVKDLSVTLKSDGQTTTFYVPKTDKLALHEVGQLLKGDKVTVLWKEEEGRKWVRDVDGEGVVEGRVTALGDAWIEVQLRRGSDEGRKLRFRAPWRGGNPADGGGPDREVVRKLGTLRAGDRIALSWAMPEGKRILDVKLRERGPSEPGGDLTKAPPELYGLSGRVVGRLVDKDVEKGELTLEIVKVDRVWRGNKAKKPQSAEGRTLKIDGVFGKFLDVLLTLEKGDGVQIEVKHVRGDGLTFLGEELKKIVIEQEDEPASAAPGEGDGAAAPAGLNGFRGILVGKLLEKDVEKGTLLFRMERVKRVWKANRAPAPEKSVGKPLAVEGIAGKFLDTLLLLEVGDRIEVEAFHVRGSTLKFPGEWLKKAEE